MQPEDLAEYMVAQLKLNQRIFYKAILTMGNKPFLTVISSPNF